MGVGAFRVGGDGSLGVLKRLFGQRFFPGCIRGVLDGFSELFGNAVKDVRLVWIELLRLTVDSQGFGRAALLIQPIALTQ